jgi:hypothetical protein
VELDAQTRAAMQAEQRAKKPRAPKETSLSTLPEDTLRRIFALAETEQLRTLRLLDAALQASAAAAELHQPTDPWLRVEICGLSADTHLYHAMQHQPAPPERATLAARLQRAAGGWLLQAAPERPGRGTLPAPMDGRGACTGVAALHRELVRGCIDVSSGDLTLHRAWGAATAAWCRPMLQRLADIGKAVRSQDQQPPTLDDRQAAVNIEQRQWNTPFGPEDDQRRWNAHRDDEMHARIESLEAKAALPPGLSASEAQQLAQLNERLEKWLLFMRMPPHLVLPRLLPAYEAKPDRDKRRSDSYVGLFALVQLAAAAEADLALLRRAQARMRAVLLLMLEGDTRTRVANTGAKIANAAEFERRVETNAIAEPPEATDSGPGLLLTFALRFPQESVWWPNATADAPDTPNGIHKEAKVTVLVDANSTFRQMQQQVESNTYTIWTVECDATNQDEFDGIEYPTIEYRARGQADAPARGWPQGSEWVHRGDFHRGPQSCRAQKRYMQLQGPPVTHVFSALATAKTGGSLMHYLPPQYATGTSMEQLLGDMHKAPQTNA